MSAASAGGGFLSTSLRCPAENASVLEQISEVPKGGEYPKGARNRLKGFVKEGECRRIVLGYDKAGSSETFIDNLDTATLTSSDSETRNVLGNARSQCNILLNKVCLGSAEYRRRYYEMVEQNRRTLGKRPGDE
jgi:hypothetical protein